MSKKSITDSWIYGIGITMNAKYIHPKEFYKLPEDYPEEVLPQDYQDWLDSQESSVEDKDKWMDENEGYF